MSVIIGRSIAVMSDRPRRAADVRSGASPAEVGDHANVRAVQTCSQDQRRRRAS
jgi:hypothetical protein